MQCNILAIIPAYNEEKIIHYPVLSLLNQKFNSQLNCNLNIAVIDDSSTDNTCNKVIEIKEKKKAENLTCIKLKFRPKYEVANYAVARIVNFTVNRIGRNFKKPDYIMIIGADTILKHDYTNNIITELEKFNAKHSETKAVAACGIIVNEPRGKLMPSGTGLIVQYEAFQKVGGLKPEPAEDTGLILRIIKEGWKILIVKNAKMYVLRPTGERENIRRCYLQGLADEYFCTALMYAYLKFLYKLLQGKIRCSVAYIKGYLMNIRYRNNEYCRVKRLLEYMRFIHRK